MRIPVLVACAGLLVGVTTTCSGDAAFVTREPEINVVVPQDRYAEVNGIRLHFLDWGGEGDLFLLIPGLTHTAHTYDAIGPAFTNRFRVVAITRREHGASGGTGAPIDLETLVDDLDAFLALFPNRQFILVGQSYAGLEMPRLAKRHPDRVRALIFLDAIYDWRLLVQPGPPFPGFFVPPSSFDSYGNLEAWFRDVFPEIWNGASRAHLVSQVYVASDGSIRWRFPIGGPQWARFLEVEGTWTPDEYEGLEQPILSIQVEQGGFMANTLEKAGAPAESVDTARVWANEFDNVSKQRGRDALAAAAPHAIMVHYENTHHWLHLQSPDRVIQDIEDFLARQLGR